MEPDEGARRDLHDHCGPRGDLRARQFWPVHPLDEEPPLVTSHKTLYLGAAGTLWALWYLAREAVVALRYAPQEYIGSVLDAYRAQPDIGKIVPSYYVGEAGVLLVHWRLTGSGVSSYMPAVSRRCASLQ